MSKTYADLIAEYGEPTQAWGYSGWSFDWEPYAVIPADSLQLSVELAKGYQPGMQWQDFPGWDACGANAYKIEVTGRTITRVILEWPGAAPRWWAEPYDACRAIERQRIAPFLADLEAVIERHKIQIDGLNMRAGSGMRFTARRGHSNLWHEVVGDGAIRLPFEEAP